MKKKFLNVMLLCALLFGVTSMFTSCKDYDEDINNLQEQINTNKADYTSQLADLQAKMTKEYEALKSDLLAKEKALQDALNEANKEIKAAQDAAAAAQKTGDKALVEAGLAKEAAAQAKKDAIAAAQKMVDTLKSELNAKITEINDLIAAQQKEIKALQENKVDKAVYDEQVKAFNEKFAALDTEISGIKSDIAKLDGRVKALELSVDEIIDDIDSIRNDIVEKYNDLNEKIQANTELINAKYTELKELHEELANTVEENRKDLQAKIDVLTKDLQDNVKRLDSLINENSKAILAAVSRISALETKVAQQEETLKEYKKLIDANTAGVKANKEAIEAIQKDIAALTGRVEDLEADVEKLYGEIERLDGEVERLDGEIARLDGEVERLDGKIDEAVKAINERFTKYAEGLNKFYDNEFTPLKKAFEELSEKVNKLEEALNALDAVVAKRLTSIVYQPQFYYHGVPAIIINQIAFYPYVLDDDFEYRLGGVTAKDAKHVKAEENNTIYHIDPIGAEVNSDDFTVVVKDAYNQVYGEDPEKPVINGCGINVVRIDKLADGSLNVVLKEDIHSVVDTLSYNLYGPNDYDPNEGWDCADASVKFYGPFTQMAIESTIELTEAEKAAGKSPKVRSDWAGLLPKIGEVRIHNAEQDPIHCFDYGSEPETYVAADCPHFYDYTTIHSKGTGLDHAKDIQNTDGKFIVREIDYRDELDLNTLVDICNNNDEILDQDLYPGFSFRFFVPDYCLISGTPEETNQGLFVDQSQIDKGIIGSQAMNGTPDNEDAIGREPMIGIELVYTDGEDEYVVDVRYIKIRWAIKPFILPASDEPLIDAEVDWDCSAIYADVKEYADSRIMMIGTPAMNNIYAIAQEEGYSKVEFHKLFDLDPKVYATEKDVKAGTPAALKGVDQLELVSSGSGIHLTHNVKWNYSSAVDPITAKEYAAGVAERTFWGRFVNNVYDNQVIYFSMNITLNVKQVKLAVGYNESYWMEDEITPLNPKKVFRVNPALTSDPITGIDKFFDTQIITNVFNAYILKDLSIPTLPEQLVAKTAGVNVDFLFDEDRFEEFGLKDWEAEQVGPTRDDLIYKGEHAAFLREKASELHFGLSENPRTTATTEGIAVEAARALVGRDIPVKVVATTDCGYLKYETVIDRFVIHVMHPLMLTVASPKDGVKDIVSHGSTIDISKLHSIVEDFGERRVLVKDGIAQPIVTSDKLYQWYEFDNLVWDLENAKVSMKFDGTSLVILPESTPFAEWGDFTSAINEKYNFTMNGTLVQPDPKKLGYYENPTSLTYENKTSSALSQGFKLAIPVYFETKWEDVYSSENGGYVIVNVVPSL